VSDQGYSGYATLSHNKQYFQAIANDTVLSKLSGAKDSIQGFQIDVPSGATNLNVRTWGGSGDCDLCLIYSRPDFYEEWSENYSNDEEITISFPNSGTWYIGLAGWERYNGLNLRAAYDSDKPKGFDCESYLDANPDLPPSWGKAECMNHYIHYGYSLWFLGKSCSQFQFR
jgi:hypothetical protein